MTTENPGFKCPTCWSMDGGCTPGTCLHVAPAAVEPKTCTHCRKPVDGPGREHPECFWREMFERERRRANDLAAALDKAKREANEILEADILNERYRTAVLGVTSPPETP